MKPIDEQVPDYIQIHEFKEGRIPVHKKYYDKTKYLSMFELIKFKLKIYPLTQLVVSNENEYFDMRQVDITSSCDQVAPYISVPRFTYTNQRFHESYIPHSLLCKYIEATYSVKIKQIYEFEINYPSDVEALKVIGPWVLKLIIKYERFDYTESIQNLMPNLLVTMYSADYINPPRVDKTHAHFTNKIDLFNTQLEHCHTDKNIKLPRYVKNLYTGATFYNCSCDSLTIDHPFPATTYGIAANIIFAVDSNFKFPSNTYLIYTKKRSYYNLGHDLSISHCFPGYPYRWQKNNSGLSGLVLYNERVNYKDLIECGDTKYYKLIQNIKRQPLTLLKSKHPNKELLQRIESCLLD